MFTATGQTITRDNKYIFRPDGVGTVTLEEKDKFQDVKERLRVLLEKQITNFRYCFPFGRPEGALKGTLSLLERVKPKLICMHNKGMKYKNNLGINERRCIPSTS